MIAESRFDEDMKKLETKSFSKSLNIDTNLHDMNNTDALLNQSCLYLYRLNKSSIYHTVGMNLNRCDAI